MHEVIRGALAENGAVGPPPEADQEVGAHGLGERLDHAEVDVRQLAVFLLDRENRLAQLLAGTLERAAQELRLARHRERPGCAVKQFDGKRRLEQRDFLAHGALRHAKLGRGLVKGTRTAHREKRLGAAHQHGFAVGCGAAAHISPPSSSRKPQLWHFGQKRVPRPAMCVSSIAVPQTLQGFPSRP